MVITIRTASKQDLPAIQKLDNLVFNEMAYPILVIRQFYDISNHFYVAENEAGEIIGYTLGHLDYNTKKGWILALAVLKDYQKTGTGYRLSTALIDSLCKLEAQTVRLTVHPDNIPAIGLYRKLNFRPIETETDYFGIGESRLIMERKM